MTLKMSLLSTAGFLTFIVAISGAFRLIPEQPISAQITPIVQPSIPVQPDVKQPVHPDEPIPTTLNQRFSLGESLQRLQQIRSSLTSFRQLTEKSSEPVKAGIGNIAWDTQNLGFANWPNSVEGTLRYQDYQIKQLEFKLAEKQYADGEITQSMLNQKQVAYQKAAREFQTFWNSYKIAD